MKPLQIGEEVIVRHIGGEERAVSIVSIDESGIWVAWPMCGHYRIRLWAHKKASAKAVALIGKLERANQWSLVDLQTIKRRAYGHTETPGTHAARGSLPSMRGKSS